MRILLIGCGGIGSWLAEEIALCIEQGQIDPYTRVAVADGDIVEVEQQDYQNFNLAEVGVNKARALAKRHENTLTAIPKRISSEAELEGYDVLLLGVDNERTRELVIRFCHKHGKEFIDLRATGRRIFAMPKDASLEANLRFVDSRDTQEYSCQDKADLEKGWIQKGNKIVAMHGAQMLLNLLRGHNNRTISMVV